MVSRINIVDLYASETFGGVLDLSVSSRAIALSAVAMLHHRYLYDNDGESLTDSEWDILDDKISLTLDELMTGITGFIFPAIWQTVDTTKYLVCDGSVYNRVDYPALYAILHSQYILTANTFYVPDLRNRFVVGAGSTYNVADTGGADSVTLTINQMPVHNHKYNQYTFGVDIESVGVPDPTGVGNPTIPQVSTNSGGGASHENRPPYYALKYYIVAQ